MGSGPHDRTQFLNDVLKMHWNKSRMFRILILLQDKTTRHFHPIHQAPEGEAS